MIKINKIYNENCLDTMKRMEDNVIDLTVTSKVVCQSCSQVYITEYLEGASFDKTIELYNPTNQIIKLKD